MIRGSLVSAARHFADNFSVGRPANRRPLLLVRVVADCFQRESTHEPLAHVTVGDRSPEPDDLADEDVQQVVLEPEHERLGRGSPESSSRRGSLGPLTVSRERIHCPSLARTRSSSCRAYQLSASTLGASAVGLAKRFRPAGVLTSETVWLKWMRYAEGMVAALTPGRLDQSFSGRFLKVATHPALRQEGADRLPHVPGGLEREVYPTFSADSTGRAALHELAQPRSGVGNFEARETAALRIEDDDLVLAGRQIDSDRAPRRPPHRACVQSCCGAAVGAPRGFACGRRVPADGPWCASAGRASRGGRPAPGGSGPRACLRAASSWRSRSSLARPLGRAFGASVIKCW